MTAFRACAPLFLLSALYLAAAEDISTTTQDADTTENPNLDAALAEEHSGGVSQTNLSNQLNQTDAERSEFSAPRFYNLTTPLKPGTTVKDIAKLVSTGEEGTAIVRRKRTFHKKCYSCGGGGGGGGGGWGGGGGYAMPIVIKVYETKGGGGCGGGGCGGGGHPQQNPCGHGGCQQQQPVYRPPPQPVYHPPPQQVVYVPQPVQQQHEPICDPCQQRGQGGGGHPQGGGSWSYSQSSAQSSSSSGTWGKK